MPEQSLRSDPVGYGPRHPHLAMLSDSTLNVDHCKSVDDFFIDSLTAYASSRSVHLDNKLPPALLNPLDKQVSCQSLRH